MSVAIYNDLKGIRFGKLVVIEKDENNKRKNYWLCKCDCGKNKSIFRGHLTANRIDHCGCLSFQKKSAINKTHGETNTRLFKIWNGMRDRCRNPHNHSYSRYGGRGISVCTEWSDFLTFKTWALFHGYNDTLSIDRIDNNGNYEPENCRWATNKQQANNKRNSQIITYNDETYSLSEWSEKLKIPIETLRARVRKNWSIEKIIITPLR